MANFILGVTINWGNLTMKFNQAYKAAEIRGDPTLARKVVSLEALMTEKKNEVSTMMWGLGETELGKGDKGEGELT